MAVRVSDHSSLRPAGQLVGRAGELARLGSVLHRDAPTVVFLNGVAGVGKTSLLRALSWDARNEGAIVIHLDCRTLEPTDRGVIDALSAALGIRSRTVDGSIRRLA